MYKRSFFSEKRIFLGHPCLDSHSCKEDEYCHRLIEVNEINHNYECINENTDCHGKLKDSTLQLKNSQISYL